jgi:hypothetical protein
MDNSIAVKTNNLMGSETSNSDFRNNHSCDSLSLLYGDIKTDGMTHKTSKAKQPQPCCQHSKIFTRIRRTEWCYPWKKTRLLKRMRPQHLRFCRIRRWNLRVTQAIIRIVWSKHCQAKAYIGRTHRKKTLCTPVTACSIYSMETKQMLQSSLGSLPTVRRRKQHRYIGYPSKYRIDLHKVT